MRVANGSEMLPRDPPPAASITAAAQGEVWRVGAALVLGSLPALLAPAWVERAAALHVHAGPGAGWLPAATLPVVLGASIVAMSAVILLSAPGLLLALALRRARSVHEWVLHGFALSLLVVAPLTAAVQVLSGRPISGSAFATLVLLCAAAAFTLAMRRARSSAHTWPRFRGDDVAALAAMVAAPLLLLVALAPKFYWEAFNGDGAHAFESARLLLHQSFPFFDARAGSIAGFPGATSFLFAYPASWFIRLFGELEVSARLPLILFLPPLAGALCALIGYGRERGADIALQTLLWLALAVYVVTIGFSATYSPYSADLALPATQDTLVVLAFFGFALSLLRGETGWAVVWAALTYAALPNGLLLIAFLLIAWWLVHRPVTRLELARGLGPAGAALFVIAGIPLLSGAIDGTAPGSEYGAAGLLMRFAFLQFTDFQRLAYIVVPCGIVPALALFAWRRQDRVSRMFTLLTAAYFLFVFIQAHAALHYYIPAMLFPLIVFWRMVPPDAAGRVQALVLAAACVALVLAVPSSPGVYTAAREVGESIAIEIDGYDRFDPDAMRASELLGRIVPLDWDAAVPEASFGGSPLVFRYYAERRPSDAARAYVLQPAAQWRPAAARLVAEHGGNALYVLDETRWAAQVALRPRTPAAAWLYRQPRSILFRSVPHEGRPRIISVPAVAARLGIDVDALARRFGASQ